MLKRKLKLKIKSGFTLIELLLYVAILGLLSLSISASLFLIFQSNAKSQAIYEVEEQGVQIMQVITQVIRNSEGINSPTPGLTSSSLSVNTVSAAIDPTVFSESGGAILIDEGASPVVALSNSRVVVSNLQFQNLSRSGTYGTVKIRFTLSYVNNSGRNEYDYSNTFYASASVRQN